MNNINNMAFRLASKRTMLSNCGGISQHAAGIFHHEEHHSKGSNKYNIFWF